MSLNRARVCTLGTQEDMIRLCRILLDHAEWFDEPEQNKPELTLEQLVAVIGKFARQEGGERCTFLYPMVGNRPYGDAQAESCRLTIRRHPTGLYLALFAYDSETHFQHEDWLSLHRESKMLPMMALYANDDFGMEKGAKLFAGGRVGDDWDLMGEVFLYLIAGYEEGYPPEEAVARLRKLRRTLEREDFDMSIGALLSSCIDHLAGLADALADSQALSAEMADMRANKDYEGLFQLYLTLIEAELWDIPHADKHLACLRSTHAAWVAAEGEDDED